VSSRPGYSVSTIDSWLTPRYTRSSSQQSLSAGLALLSWPLTLIPSGRDRRRAKSLEEQMKLPGTIAGLPRMTLRGSGSTSRLGLQFADRQPKIPAPSLSNASKARNSNREALRLEIAVTQRKQRTLIHSNREEKAYFSPSRFIVGGRVHHAPGLALSFDLRCSGTTLRSGQVADPCNRAGCAPLKSVSGRRERDPLFCITCEEFQVNPCFG
jgi:hypothetical protein